MAPTPLPPLAAVAAARAVAAFAGARVRVIGDAMVDRFIAGHVSRISPEAPVPVVAFDRETERAGGAANVAHNVAALGGRVTLVAATGCDEAGARLGAACRAARVEPVLVEDATRQTTTKVRIVTERNQQVARVDYETDVPVTGAAEARLVDAIAAHGAAVAAIVVSDYLKGTVTPAVMDAVRRVAARRGVPVLVDPKVPHLDLYRGAAVVTPNHHEAETAVHARVQSHADAADAARRLRAAIGCDALLMTRGDQGMWLSSEAAEGYLDASAREVADVTGAGDTVIAALALALAAGASVADGAHLANRAAGISVGRFGPAVVTPAELLAAGLLPHE
jgi:D-beta-D-heptose 7-phosphate kinase/D-beta-D-heptose 1-phosphate adenosyltransferase